MTLIGPRRRLATQPDQSGQNLAWSLGTIQGYDRASVTVTVVAGQPDPVAARHRRAGIRHARRRRRVGHHPRGDAQPGQRSTPTCSPRRPTPTRPIRSSRKRRRSSTTTRRTSSTSCTPRSATTRTWARSAVRGARSGRDAGNALDVASLGVALMRASGIPAQYVQGTLSQSQAQQLILSMFPAQLSDGRLHPGRHADLRPGQRPAAAVRDRDRTTGSSSTPAAACRTPTRSCPARRSARRSRRRPARSPPCRMTSKRRPRSSSSRRSTNTASALFGLGGQQDTTVLDQTFDDVELGWPANITRLQRVEQQRWFHLHHHDQHLLTLPGLGRRRLRLDTRSDHRGRELSRSLDQLSLREHSADGIVSKRRGKRPARSVPDLQPNAPRSDRLRGTTGFGNHERLDSGGRCAGGVESRRLHAGCVGRGGRPAPHVGVECASFKPTWPSSRPRRPRTTFRPRRSRLFAG